MNVKDLPALEAQLAAAKGTEGYQELLDSIEGPAHGVDYKEDTGKYVIASGWGVLKSNGEIVRKSEHAGPAFGVDEDDVFVEYNG